MNNARIAVADVRGKAERVSLRDEIYQLLQQIGALESIFHDPQKRVLLKPNLVYPRKSGSGIITDNRLVFGLVEVLQLLGFKDIVVGEGSAVGYDFVQNYDTFECMKVAGLDCLPEKYHVRLVDFNRDEPVEIAVPDPLVMDRVKIARTALECDIIVNLPVMKTHIRTGITAGLKNMKGVLPGNEKKKTHRLGIDEALADLASAVKADLTIVDGIVGMEGNWDYPRDCVPLGIVLAGTDRVAIDCACAKIMGFDPEKIRHLTCSAQKRLGTMDLSKIEFLGMSWDEIPTKTFKGRFQSFMEDFPGVNLIDQYGCTGCSSTILSTLTYFNKKGYKGHLQNLNIVTAVYDSQPIIEKCPGHTFILGTCNTPFKHLGTFVPGCPPKAPDLIKEIKNAYNFTFEDDFQA